MNGCSISINRTTTASSAMTIIVHLLRHTDRVLTNGLVKVNRVQTLCPKPE
jgi:hypothetical protein